MTNNTKHSASISESRGKQKLIFRILYYRGVSHSVVSDMKVIEQEKPRSDRDRYSRDRDRDFDDFEFISSSGFSSGPPK